MLYPNRFRDAFYLGCLSHGDHEKNKNLELYNVKLDRLFDMCIISKCLQYLQFLSPRMPSTNLSPGSELESHMGGRHDQGWIKNWPILLPYLLRVRGSYPYNDITQRPGVSLCIPRSGSIFILAFVRQLLARVMRSWPGQLVSRIHPPLCL